MHKKSVLRLNYRQTFLVGFGFFAVSLAWAVYNAFVPLLLERWIASTTMIGLIMTIDNVFGLIFQPVFGALSDRTRSPLGCRMPYILAGIPLCAALLALAPQMPGLASMMAVLVVFNFLMSVWRSQMVALMPDLTPSPLRNQANGVINLMGGVGTLVAFLVGGSLANSLGQEAPFALAGGLMLASLALLLFFVREPAGVRTQGRPFLRFLPRSAKAQAERGSLAGLARPGERRSFLCLLLAIFFWFCGYNAIESFFTLYAKNVLGLEGGDATMLLAFFSVTFIVVAIPAGYLANRFGRRRTIMVGLGGIILLFGVLTFLQDLWVIRVLLLLGGCLWALININSLPMVVELAGGDRIGAFTGVYYFFSFAASVLSPVLFGGIRDLLGSYEAMFPYAAVCMVLALGCMALVRHGEAVAKEAA